jgi:hypothetical protein
MEYKSPPIHRTPLYRAKAAYYGMLARCENKNGKSPSYVNVQLKMTWEEWLEWVNIYLANQSGSGMMGMP